MLYLHPTLDLATGTYHGLTEGPHPPCIGAGPTAMLGQRLEVCSSRRTVLEQPVQAKEGLLKGFDKMKGVDKGNELVDQGGKGVCENK